MEQLLHVIKANPCGNTTLIIEGPVSAENYVSVALRLMNLPGTEAEQAGFVCKPLHGGVSRLVMSGNEFCGNAARAFGFIMARKQNIQKGIVPVELSGCSALINTYVDLDKNEAFADMPLPQKIMEYTFPAPVGTSPIVCFEGIWHVLMQGRKIQEEEYHFIIRQIYSEFSPEALGILYLNDDFTSLIPVVYVHGTGTIHHESSCGSGTTAIAAYVGRMSNTDCLTIRQPAGELTVYIDREDGKISHLRMGGNVTIDKETEIVLDI